jgi:hypothetical protein
MILPVFMYRGFEKAPRSIERYSVFRSIRRGGSVSHWPCAARSRQHGSYRKCYRPNVALDSGSPRPSRRGQCDGKRNQPPDGANPYSFAGLADQDALAGVGPQAVKQLKQSANPAELQFADTPGGAGSAAVFTKLYFADISRKFRSGTLRGNTEYAMTLALLLDASTAIQAHAFAAMAAFALGVVQQDGLSCQSHAKSASGPLCRLRRCSIAAKWDGLDLRADERRAG